jgi:hypothetical protein
MESSGEGTKEIPPLPLSPAKGGKVIECAAQ